MSAAMDMLLACGEVSPQDTNRILGQLVKSFDAVSLAGLVDRLNDVMTQRLDVERKAEAEPADMAEAA